MTDLLSSQLAGHLLSVELAGWGDAWKTELRGPNGEWTRAGLIALRSMSAAEKKAYTKTGALPDRFMASAPARDVTPQPATKDEMVQHLTEHHSGVRAGGRRIGPKNPTAADLRANHAQQHQVRADLDHVHGPPITEQRRLTSMWTRAFRYSNRTQGTLRDAQFTVELHRLLSTNKPLSKYTPGAKDAHDFLGMIDRQATPQPPLYRGMQMSAADAKRLFQPGKPVDLPVSSWSKQSATGEAFSGDSGVVLQVSTGSKGLDLGQIEHGGGPELEYREGLQEVVTGGRYSVSSVTSKNGKTYVQLSQDAFDAH